MILDRFTTTPDTEFRDAIVSAWRQLATAPTVEYERNAPTSDTLGKDGVIPQSGVRGVFWAWKNAAHTFGRWCVHNPEGGVAYFEGTNEGLRDAIAYMQSRKLKRIPAQDDVLGILSMTEWMTAARVEALSEAKYSTVTVALKRFTDAGLVERRKRGKVYEYRRLS